MSIRQYVGTRVRRTLALVIVLASIVIATKKWGLPGPEYWWLDFAPFALVMLPMFYLQYFLECPKCLNPIGSDVFPIAFPLLFSWSAPRNFCQSCGKSLDEPA
jgi:hypothetical protein